MTPAETARPMPEEGRLDSPDETANWVAHGAMRHTYDLVEWCRICTPKREKPKAPSIANYETYDAYFDRITGVR